jgi:hypothetical protein
LASFVFCLVKVFQYGGYNLFMPWLGGSDKIIIFYAELFPGDDKPLYDLVAILLCFNFLRGGRILKFLAVLICTGQKICRFPQ